MSERALISLNVPNFLTIGLIAIGSFLIVGTIWQLVRQGVPGLGGPPEVTLGDGGESAGS